MDVTNDFCCICLFKHENLKELSGFGSDQITYFKKLTQSIPEMCFEEMTDKRLICGACCSSIESIHTFREKCLKSKKLLIEYVAHLHSVNNFIGNLTVQVNHTDSTPETTDIKKEIVDENAKKVLEENFDNSLMEVEQSGVVPVVGSAVFKAEDEALKDIEEVIIKSENSFEDNIQDDCEPIENPLNNFKTNLNQGTLTSNVQSTEKTYTCEYCPKVFNDSDSFKNHLQIHLIRPHKCTMCEESFRDQNSLHNHIKEHSGETIYTCHVCNKKFRSLPNFKRHFRISHIGERAHECTVCHKMFGAARTLEDHMRIHKGEFLFVCHICNKKFRHKTSYKIHLQKHNEENNTEEGVYVPYDGVEQALGAEACSAPKASPMAVYPKVIVPEPPAPKPRAYIKVLVRGPAVPRAESPPEPRGGGTTCHLCHKTFRFSSHLRRHSLVHSGQKPHVCPQCGKGFSHRSSLRRHLDCHARGTIPAGGLPGGRRAPAGSPS